MKSKAKKLDYEKARTILLGIYDDRERFLKYLSKSSPERLRNWGPDLMHDACLSFLEKAKTGDLPPTEAEAKYLFVSILKGKLWNVINRKYALVDSNLLDGLDSEEDIFRFMARGLGKERELLAACHEAREALDGVVSEVMMLRFQEQLSIQEISGRLRFSPSKTNRLLKKGKTKVRELLEFWKLIQVTLGFGGVGGGVYIMTDIQFNDALFAAYNQFPSGMPPSETAVEMVDKAVNEIQTGGGPDLEAPRPGNQTPQSFTPPIGQGVGLTKVITLASSSLIVAAVGLGLNLSNENEIQPEPIEVTPAYSAPLQKSKPRKLTIALSREERIIARGRLKCSKKTFRIKYRDSLESGCFFDLGSTYYTRIHKTTIPKNAIAEEIK